METFSLENLLGGEPILREKSFREAVDQFPWESMEGKDVLVRGCGIAVIPAWAYMLVTARLRSHARSIHFGDSTSPVLVWEANGTR